MTLADAIKSKFQFVPALTVWANSTSKTIGRNWNHSKGQSSYNSSWSVQSHFSLTQADRSPPWLTCCIEARLSFPLRPVIFNTPDDLNLSSRLPFTCLLPWSIHLSHKNLLLRPQLTPTVNSSSGSSVFSLWDSNCVFDPLAPLSLCSCPSARQPIYLWVCAFAMCACVSLSLGPPACADNRKL